MEEMQPAGWEVAAQSFFEDPRLLATAAFAATGAFRRGPCRHYACRPMAIRSDSIQKVGRGGAVMLARPRAGALAFLGAQLHIRRKAATVAARAADKQAALSAAREAAAAARKTEVRQTRGHRAAPRSDSHRRSVWMAVSGGCVSMTARR
jgi:hypothetical protein